MRNFWRTMILAALICLLPLAAFAFTPMETGWYEVIVPDGLNAEKMASPVGQENYFVKVDEADWTKAILNSKGGDAVKITVRFFSQHVSDAKYINLFTANYECDEEALDHFAWNEGQNRYGDDLAEYSNFQNNFGIAEYLSQQDAIVVYEKEKLAFYYIRWYDEDGKILKTAKLNVRVTLDQTGAFHTSQSAVIPKERILGNTERAGDTTGKFPVTGLNVSIEDGAVHYMPSQTSDRRTGVVTRIIAPAGADSWKTSMNDEYPNSLVEQNGVKYAEFTTNFEYPGINAQAICFYQGSDLLEQALVNVYWEAASDAKPWPEYSSKYGLDWQKIPDERLIIKNGAAGTGYQMTYHDGLLQTSFKGSGDDNNDSAA